ncbi:MAG TPA: phosphoesterase, partial [Limnobacter sp.]|nr:phosphoesterase [Limnobacter sp.]
IKPGTVSNVAYNHYAMLKSIENGFGLDYLGFAAQPGLVTFGVDVFTNLNP